VGEQLAWQLPKPLVARIASTENADVMRGRGVDVIEGRATLVGPKSVKIVEADGTREIVGENILIATGSSPAVPPIPGLDEVPYRTNETAFEPRPLPRSMAIIGAGPVGCELAEAMARFGTRVTLIEAGPRVLSNYEPDASTLVEEALRARGIDLHVGEERAPRRHPLSSR